MAPLDLASPLTERQATQAKVAELRTLLGAQQLDAYWVPAADEHLNEYLPEAKQRRVWLSGFTGSAGEFLVGREQSWLFVDSRYHQQAESQVDPALIQVSKLGLDDQKTLVETLEALAQTQPGLRLGFDPFTLSVAQFRELEKRLKPVGVELVPLAENLVDQVRAQRPWLLLDPLPAYANAPLFHLPDALTGETVAQKLARVREALQKAKADLLPITKLDQIAWLLNLRGNDVPCNPVFIAYAIVTPTQAFLFTALERVEAALQAALASEVTLLPYETYSDTLKNLISESTPCRVLLDAKRTTLGTHCLLPETAQIVEAANPIEGLKARKNSVEIEQMKQANLKASRAKVRTLSWLAAQFAQGQSLAESDVAATIAAFYREEADFWGLSFPTIAATGANSSIVHYSTPGPQHLLQPGQFLLLDSGAQYFNGTTDDTRTLIWGEPSPSQIERYTAVLQAHINCARQQFPKGATGSQLDGITRSALWSAGLDYGHGTGHGVGMFLNVHEGPNGIHKRAHEPLEPGMIGSIEPGFYEPGWGGIRLENLYVVVELPKADAKPTDLTWYGFEPLTYIPFDQTLIDLSRLDSGQRQWLERYHQTVLEKLSPSLEPADAQWLQQACRL